MTCEWWQDGFTAEKFNMLLKMLWISLQEQPFRALSSVAHYHNQGTPNSMARVLQEAFHDSSMSSFLLSMQTAVLSQVLDGNHKEHTSRSYLCSQPLCPQTGLPQINQHEKKCTSPFLTCVPSFCLTSMLTDDCGFVRVKHVWTWQSLK